MMLVKKQPLKTFFILYAVVVDSVYCLIWALLYLFPGLRPVQSWSYRRALNIRIQNWINLRSATLENSESIFALLKPKSTAKRQIGIETGNSSLYIGIAVASAVIQPEPFDMSWYDERLSVGDEKAAEATVILHFASGAFVVGEGWGLDFGSIAGLLLKQTPATNIAIPLYRLSSSSGGQFPAALQDAISAYSYLINKVGVPANRIFISGDSAGGNLALALARYISEHGQSVQLPWPAGLILLSPWIDIAKALEFGYGRGPLLSTSDFTSPIFLHWGPRAYTAGNEDIARSPYITPISQIFPLECPMFIKVGGVEALAAEAIRLAKDFEEGGSHVEVFVSEDSPHDIMLLGEPLGFQEEASQAAKEVGNFIDVTKKVNARTV